MSSSDDSWTVKVRRRSRYKNFPFPAKIKFLFPNLKILPVIYGAENDTGRELNALSLRVP